MFFNVTTVIVINIIVYDDIGDNEYQISLSWMLLFDI